MRLCRGELPPACGPASTKSILGCHVAASSCTDVYVAGINRISHISCEEDNIECDNDDVKNYIGKLKYILNEDSHHHHHHSRKLSRHIQDISYSNGYLASVDDAGVVHVSCTNVSDDNANIIMSSDHRGLPGWNGLAVNADGDDVLIGAVDQVNRVVRMYNRDRLVKDWRTKQHPNAVCWTRKGGISTCPLLVVAEPWEVQMYDHRTSTAEPIIDIGIPSGNGEVLSVVGGHCHVMLGTSNGVVLAYDIRKGGSSMVGSWSRALKHNVTRLILSPHDDKMLWATGGDQSQLVYGSWDKATRDRLGLTQKSRFSDATESDISNKKDINVKGRVVGMTGCTNGFGCSSNSGCVMALSSEPSLYVAHGTPL